MVGVGQVNGEPKKIVLIGASARPLIASCLRAGCVPVAFDFFADWDARRLVESADCVGASLTKIDGYGDLIGREMAGLGDAAILAGGAELRAELVVAVGRQLPLLGARAGALAAVADPIEWLQVLCDAGVRVPESVRELPADSRGDWLVKQRGACGGSGVRAIERQSEAVLLGDCYYQKRICGESLSAVFVSRGLSNDSAGGTFSLGCTRQWLAGDFGDRVRPFTYRGSVGPIVVGESVNQQLDRIANVLADAFSLVGVWGGDFVLDADGQVWLVDLNPRITASAELFETAVASSGSGFRSVVDLHWSACDSERGARAEEFAKLAKERSVGCGIEICEAKRIVFFDGPGVWEIDQASFKRLSRLYVADFFQSNQVGVSIADIPQVGDRIEAGRPLLTVRSRAKTEAAAVALLEELLVVVKACWRE